MSLWVIDASVAAKWFLPPAGEPLVEEALNLLRRYAKGQIQLVTPELFWAECANIFWKAVWQGRWTSVTAHEALTALRGRDLRSVPALELLDEAFTIAMTFERSVYDGLYVALAVRSKAQLVTADKKLANALAAHLPVKWLGSAWSL